MEKLKFSPANAKTTSLMSMPALSPYLTPDPTHKRGRKVFSFDLPAGKTCPGARLCKSTVVATGNGFRIQDGPHCEYRCFSASQEVLYPSVRKARKHNYDTIQSIGTRNYRGVARHIMDSMPPDLGVCRLHVAGDFFNLSYLRAWLTVAALRPDCLFYTYTKSLPFLTKVGMYIAEIGKLRSNFLFTASYGGKYDHLISQLNMRSAEVVYTEHEATTLHLPIDHTDVHAATTGGSFALLIHGPQPKGSAAGRAWHKLKMAGSGYSRR